MSNGYHNKQTAPLKKSGGRGGAESGSGSVPQGREGTANWPGLPGKTGPNRSGGTKTTGHCGPFYHKKAGI